GGRTMTKKIAVLIRDRQSEALRMSLGLTLLDDSIEAFVLDSELEKTEQNMDNIELMTELDVNIYSNNTKNEDLRHMPFQEIALQLVEYDHILVY
ncbi:MAG: hypothetical protein ACC651_18195, partial [Candidatus Scalindua sp.]